MAKRITFKDLKRDMKNVGKEVNGVITVSDYEKHGTHSLETIHNRYDSWEKAKRNLGIDVEKRKEKNFRKIVSGIKERGLRGWVNFREIQEIARERGTHLNPRAIDEFMEFINDNDEKIRITKGEKKLFVKQMDDVLGIEKYREEFTDKKFQAIYDLVGHGCDPSVVAATVKWLCGNESQENLAEEHGTTPLSMRMRMDDVREALMDNGVCDECGKEFKSKHGVLIHKGKKDNRNV